MTADRVLKILRLLDAAGLDIWVDGGWGVAALKGEQTREHKDLDLGVARADLDRTIEVLGTMQYAVSDDRFRQVTVQLLDVDGNKIDLHPSDRLPDGGSEQLGFDDVQYYIPPPVQGFIGGEVVRCMPVECQIRNHSGYDLRPQDHHDLAILRSVARLRTASATRAIMDRRQTAR